MSVTWQSNAPPPVLPPVTARGWVRVALRGVPLAVLVFGGLAVSLILRVVERPLFGMSRPITPAITVFVCRNALRIIGIDLKTQGRPMASPGALVANHASWLDVFVLNASQRIYFVSKAEVAKWPGIGWLARATGTVFIERNRTKAAQQSDMFQKRLTSGHRLVFFPEGTSSDGQRVLPFKSSLFAAFLAPELKECVSVQPVSLCYHAPCAADPRYYGWWGAMDFAPHMLRILANRKQGHVTVVYGAPIKAANHATRKDLAAFCEKQVRSGYEIARAPLEAAPVR